MNTIIAITTILISTTIAIITACEVPEALKSPLSGCVPPCLAALEVAGQLGW